LSCKIFIFVLLVFSFLLARIATTPLTAASQAIRARVLAKASHVQSDTNAGASSLAAEVIGGFRTVLSFDWQDEAVNRYSMLLQKTKADSRKEVHVNGVVFGLSYLLMFWVNALIFWYGSTLVFATPANGGITQGDFIIVFMSVLMSAMGLGQAVAISPDFAKSRGAAANLFDVMNRIPLIDANPSGVKDVSIIGVVELENVVFRYPARPDTLVLNHVSLQIAPGSVIAFVGRSGAGKSTIVGLVERFYDVADGCVRIDGRNIKDYDLRWLRRQIGLVSQEPTLFDSSIAENIRFGRTGLEEVSMAEVEAAAKAANAHDFIMKLDEGYNTRVGERGTQMSGGQKQRIAIARAILKNPAILLLDEATSALDSESEALVQDALDKLMKGRTTIVIAHRLSTIRNANVICAMANGQIVEMGSHDELIAKHGYYFDLIAHQM
jgi:ATP-binding cassette subfamily B (MDR/TAP) protein 1